MYRWFLAYKYLLRLITLAALLGVTYSVTVLIVVVSVMEGFRSELETRIRSTTSDVRVESTRFVGLENPQRVEDLIRTVPGVTWTAPIVETLALYRRGWPWPSQESSDRLLLAFDLANEHSVDELDSYIRSVAVPTLDGPGIASSVQRRIARLIDCLPRSVKETFSEEWVHRGLNRCLSELGRVPPEAPAAQPYLPAIVGLETLRQEALLPGSLFELTSFSPIPPHEPRTCSCIVVGYFKTGLYDLDAKGIVLTMEDADRFLKLRGDDGALRVSAVRTGVDEAHGADAALDALKGLIAETVAKNDVLFVKVQTWREARDALLRAVSMEKFIVSIILGVVTLFAGFMIFIILTVQVVERSRDIGVLVSLGSTERGIAVCYFLTGLSLCLGGTVLGTIYGVSFALSINTVQRWIKLLTGLELFPQDVYYLDHIPVRFQPEDLIFIIVPTVAASLLASIVPAIRAARRDPIASLRYK